MLDPVLIRRAARIRSDWQLRSRLTACHRVAAYLASITDADYRATLHDLCALPRERVIRLLRKTRRDAREQRLGPFATIVRTGRENWSTPISQNATREPDTADTDRLPGEVQARQYLQRVTRSGEATLFNALSNAGGEAHHVPSAWTIWPTPEQALNALLILRLAHGLRAAGCDKSALSPENGEITIIAAPRFKDREQLEALLPEWTLRRHAGPMIVVEGDPAARKDAPERLREALHNTLLLGRGVVAIVASPDVLPAALAAASRNTIFVPPPTGAMLAGVMSLLHQAGDRFPIAASDSCIARLLPTDLAIVFAARDGAMAQSRLRKVLEASGAGAGVKLDDVFGQTEAVQSLRQAVADLHCWQAVRTAWADVTRSFLLHGPPGTGKTMLAQALAGSAGIPLIKTSYSECQKNGHQGDMLRALHAAAEQAIASAPSVFFIDEIDSFYLRDMPGNHSSGYIIGVVNGLLTLIDRLLATPGVVLIAATNDRARVDPAVIRAGRFDRHIRIGLPDRAGIQHMLRAGLPADLGGNAADELADQLLGLSGAEITAVLRDARTRARTAGRSITGDDLGAAAHAVMPKADAGFLRRVAIHEAGHLLAGHLLGLEMPIRAQITARGGFVERPVPGMLTQGSVAAHLQLKLAGRAAEALLCGDMSSGSGAGAQSDLAQATQLALEAEANFGFGPQIAWHSLGRPLTLMPAEICRRVEERLQRAAAEVRELLASHAPSLEKIAAELLAARDLSAPDLARLLAAIPGRAGNRQCDL